MWILTLSIVLAAPSIRQEPRLLTRKLSAPLPVGPVATSAGRFVPDPSGARVLVEARNDDSLRSWVVVVDADGTAPTVSLGDDDHEALHALAWAPDGSRAIWSASVLGRKDVYVAPTDGSAPPRALLPPGVRLHADEVRLAGSSRAVVLGALESAPSIGRVYALPLDGTPGVELNGPLVPGGSVRAMKVAGAVPHAVYTADQDLVGQIRLHSAPADGGGPVRELSPPLQPSEDVDEFQIAPGGTHVVFRVRATASHHALYSAPVDGSAPAVLLTQPAAVGPEIWEFQALTSGLVLYRGRDARTAGSVELLRVPLDGSAPDALLSTSAPGNVDLLFPSADGQWAVYGRSVSGSPDDTLHSVRTDGSAAPVTLDPVVRLLADSVQVTPDSTRVAFVDRPSSEAIVVMPIDGSAAPVAVTAPQRVVSSLGIAPDSQTLVYSALESLATNQFELFRVPLVPDAGGPTGVRLHDPLAANVQFFTFALGGARVLFAPHGLGPLLSSALAGPPDPLQIAPPPRTDVVGDVSAIFAARGRTVYLADQEVDEQVELFGCPSDGSAPPVRLSPPFVAGGDVRNVFNSVQISRDGRRVVFQADAEVDGRLELYGAPTDGSAPAVKLNTALVTSSSVGEMRLSPDGTRVAYFASQTSAPGSKLWSVPSTGGVPVALASVGSTNKLAFTPDSAHVVFESPSSGGPLHAVPAAGGTPAVLLTSEYVPFQYAVTATRLVYLASHGGAQRVWSVPLSGGPPTDLGPPLVADGAVREFELAPDGRRVVFIADAFTNGRFELFSVPTDRSLAPIVINGPLAAGGDVGSVLVSPDGTRVIYEADQEVNNEHHLYSVPIAGGPWVRLFSGEADADDYRITPLGSFVVSTAGGQVRVMPITGGAATTVTDVLSTSSVLFTPDERRVVLTAASGALRSVPLRGGPPLELTPPGNPVARFVLDGPGVVYVNDVEDLSRQELYSVFPGKRVVAPPPR